ncbi:hypothetical protein PY650_25260 [Rhizobium calliandrae]|uniref:Uncharacterized protein n=1 Tax=Rhizobium calliandrae TaxID=1312182 RepID=A0ABT7KL78_9HYPH|nr:hypothetical protein [Rhizobium calliandrae]MDL2408887.1 hypothetical protein [Rhizobium calliandrae]
MKIIFFAALLFGLESLRELPDLDRWEDAGLLNHQALEEGAIAEIEGQVLED